MNQKEHSPKTDFRTFLKLKLQAKEPVFFDGGMGTMIQKTGISYKIPEDLNFYKRDIILDIHLQYLKAGSHVLTANSFGANPIKLAGEPSSHSAEEYIREAVAIQKEAIATAESQGISGPHFCSWDSGQIGKLLEPMGTLTFDQAYESYKTAAIAAEKAGADLAIIETMSDLYEVKAAVLAIQENTSLPIVATMTFQNTLRTLTGADVLTCVTYLESLHVDVIGFNCGGALDEDIKLAQQFMRYARLPVLVQPNAGLPEVVNGRDVFKVEADEFAATQTQIRTMGASLLGGCCGTTPAHIAAVVQSLKEHDPYTAPEHDDSDSTFVCSCNKSQQVGGSYGPVIIGERINPTGKKKCKEALMQNNMDFIIGEAESQINAGAHILDVNVGLPGIDEAEMMVHAVKTIQSTFNTPLQLDSSEPPVLEKALRYYNGKALVNSVNGKQEIMDRVFPLIKHYGGAVVALCIDEDGIAPTAQGRVKVADKIICEAAKYGIPVRDIFIDTLTLTVSSEQKTALETVRAIRLLKEKYGKDGIQFVLGVSNISFGLPRRDIINSRFYTLCLDAGLSAAIINPGSQQMMDTYRAYRSLAGYDENCLDFIQTYTGTTDPTTAKFKETVLSQAVEQDSFPAELKQRMLEKAVEDGSIAISINGSESKKAEAVRRGAADVSNKSPAGKDGASSQGSGNTSAGSANSSASGSTADKDEQALIQIIEKGFKDQAFDATAKVLQSHQAAEVIDRCIVPALDSVGKDFETGKKFLPQLLLSADTVGNSFAKIKETLSASGASEQSKGTIVIATVYGDIHDIGKNIVKAMLENYGYTVIDLGKNVPSETVVTTVLENDIQLVGLSALMTTTVANMEQTIIDLRAALKKQNKTCRIMVGGAVLTADYAEKIGADYYAKDAMESVAIAKEIFG